MKRIIMVLAVAALLIISARGQDFENLNFESAYNLPGNPGFNGESIPVSNALPSWTAYADGNAISSVYYVSNTAPGASTPVELESGSLALSGEFSAGLYGGGSISQTGMVPDNAESLQFEAKGPGPGGSVGPLDLVVDLGGQTLSFSEISEGPDYYVYGANIPVNMDGDEEALIFGDGSPAGILLDDIDFSPESVPEPAEWGLIGVGAILLGFRCCRKQTFSITD